MGRIGVPAALGLLAILAAGAAWAQGAGTLPYATIATGPSSGISAPAQVVVRDAGSWRALWTRHAGPGSAPPAVDFQGEMVIALFAGRQTPTTLLSIHRIVREPQRLVVFYMLTESRPLPPAEEARRVTPFLMVRVSRSPLPVAFVYQRTPPVIRPPGGG